MFGFKVQKELRNIWFIGSGDNYMVVNTYQNPSNYIYKRNMFTM